MPDPLTRLQMLERTVAALAAGSRRRGQNQGEALVPNYLTIDPTTGLVTAQFSGVVTGSLVLPEGTGSSRTPANSVAWTDDGTPGGTVHEYLQAYLVGGVHTLDALSIADATDFAGISSKTQAGGAAGSATVTAEAVDSTAGGVAHTPQIIGSDGKSAFPMLPPNPGNVGLTPPARTQTLWGSLASGAVIPTVTSSGGFSVAKVAVGQYTVTFSQVFADTGYSLTVTAGNGYCTVNTRAAGHCQVNLFNSADVLTDMVWSFIAIGTY